MTLSRVVQLIVGVSLCAFAARAADKPNIVFILCDDLGYGDVRCLNPDGRISTPNIDRLAREGMIFTDAHSSSAVCTPTRYGLLTGRYNWRSRLQSGVQGGMSPPLIERDRLTVAALLKQHGYATACIGKWHLGMEWPLKPGAPAFNDNIERGEHGWRVDFTKPIRRGPNSVGFDYFFGIAASLDMVPYTFIENGRVTAPPVADKAFAMMHGRTNKLTRRGPAAEQFEAEDVLPTLTRKAIEFIARHAAGAKRGQPFFLYLPLNSPHTPIAPTKEWLGRSDVNPYADFVMQTDASVGAVLKALDENGVAENTLVIFTSDNGCSPEADYKQLAQHGHDPSHVFRGTKADIFEGGHRVPFIARWPGNVASRARSDQLVCLNDFMATCAEILGAKLPDHAGEDSISFLPALRGGRGARDSIVHHSINGSFAIRQGEWKLALCSSSGGWSEPRPGTPAARTLPTNQLFDLSIDIGERTNVAAAHPEIVARLTALLEKYVADGRSTPGAPQSNTVPVVLRKGEPAPASTKRPNIIVVITDDQGYGDLSCHGNPILKTPNLDAFHRQSVRFTDFNVSPTCAPTRAALMTGRHEFRNGVTHTIFERERLTTNAVTIAQVLKGAGYRTGIFGKWHLGDEPEYWPSRRGFDEMFIHGAGGIGQTYAGSCGDAPGNSYFDPVVLHNGRFVGTVGYCTDVFFNEATQWIEAQRASGEPFFAWIALNAPHAPLDCPPAYMNRYTNLTGGNTNAAKFFGMIANIDDNFGRLTAALREWKIETNTLVIFLTDNGGTVGVPIFNAGMRGGKATPFLGATRVPSFWRWPAGFAGDVDCDRLTAHLDVFSTLAEIAGAPLSDQTRRQVEGRSLLPLLRAPNAAWPDRTLVTHVGRWEHGQAAESKFRNASIRNTRFQLVSAVKPKDDATQPKWEMFDLQADRGQKTNVLNRFPDAARELATAYDRWWSEVQPWLVNENVRATNVNPFKALYWKQFGGGPDARLRRQMDPAAKSLP